MKIPCEIIVWYVLPIVRREVANELVSVHHMTQAEVARKFGVTDAAISQYLKKKRGDSEIIESSPKYPDFTAKIKESAALIAQEKTSFEEEMCRVCQFVKETGILAEIYKQQFGTTEVVCPHMCSGVVISRN